MEIIINIEKNTTPETIEEVFKKYAELLSENEIDLEVNYAEECKDEEDTCCQCDNCQGCCDDECEGCEEDEYLERYTLGKLYNSDGYEEQLKILKEYGQIRQEDGQQEITNNIVGLLLDKGIEF